MRYLIYRELAAKGIRYSRQHLKRLVAQKKFPPPVKGICKENAWGEDVIDQHIADCVASAKREIAT